MVSENVPKRGRENKAVNMHHNRVAHGCSIMYRPLCPPVDQIAVDFRTLFNDSEFGCRSIPLLSEFRVQLDVQEIHSCYLIQSAVH